MSDEQRQAGVPYEVTDGVWVTPIVAPPGQRRQPLAEVNPIAGRRVVFCGRAGYEWDLYTWDEPVLGRDLDLAGEAAAQMFVAVVTWEVWAGWRFQGRDPEPAREIRLVPLYACWIDPYLAREAAEGA